MQQVNNMKRFNLLDTLSSVLLTYIAFLFFTSSNFPFAIHWEVGKMRLWVVPQPWLGVFGLLFLFLAIFNILDQ